MKCKPGDLAITLKAWNEAHLGVVVTVVEWAHPNEYEMEGGLNGAGWLVRFADESLGVWGDCSLMPIRPEGEPLEVDQELEVAA
jgi:hypothetical protein